MARNLLAGIQKTFGRWEKLSGQQTEVIGELGKQITAYVEQQQPAMTAASGSMPNANGAAPQKQRRSSTKRKATAKQQ